MCSSMVYAIVRVDRKLVAVIVCIVLGLWNDANFLFSFPSEPAFMGSCVPSDANLFGL